MKVLVACESSGIVREAFKKRGHDVWSCDRLPTEIEGQHIIGDALPLLEQHWDLNPIGIMNSRYRKADQTIHPFFFGHAQAKKTCLWLRGLPKLIPTKIVDVPFGPNGMRVGIKYTKIPKGEERWKFRSRTFQGIADAMADQWGNL